MKTFAQWCQAKCFNPVVVRLNNPRVRCHHCLKDMDIRKANVNDFDHFVCNKCAKTYEVPEDILMMFP